MVSLKGETGCVGFFYALAHTFMGFICADPAYKTKWFDKETGRLFWNYEVCLATGCWATTILFFVTLRTLYSSVTVVGTSCSSTSTTMVNLQLLSCLRCS